MSSGSVEKNRTSRLQRALRGVGALFDPRAWAHGIKILNFYNYTHVQQLRLITRGSGVHISPTVNFSNGENVELRDGCRVGAGSILWGGHGTAKVIIGREATLGPNVLITAANYRFNDGAPVHAQLMKEADTVVGEDVWLAASVTILPGVTVGDGAIVGAGTVIREDVPPGAIVAGNPSAILGWRKGFETPEGTAETASDAAS